jgi:HicA toxin of bacterial toxin-antitoxin,
MSKLEKLIEQFLRDPPEVRFDDVQYLLESFGFEEKRSKGSHRTFRNSDGLKFGPHPLAPSPKSGEG